jgi:purine-nucleoside phosphorylase
MLKNTIEIKSNEIPFYPVSTVIGHEGKLIFGYWEKIPLVAVKGRTHYYEGYDIKQVVFIIRILAALGVKLLIVTNAAGGINRRLKPGDLMLISDQINLMFANPLIGPVEFGEPRFPDMSDAYSEKFQRDVEDIAMARNIQLKKGTLYASSGPSYETRSEVKMVEKFGGDAVSMSTIPEVIAANHSGLSVIGISCITNMATGISTKPLSHDEVTQTAAQARNKFFYLITGIIERLGKSNNL